MQQRDKLFINGKWVAPQAKGVIEVIHSATEEVMGTIPEGSAADAEAAVTAARAAFDGWAATPVAKRAEYVQKIADGLKARSEELAQLIAGEVGMPIKLARAIQVGGPVYNWGNFAKLLGTFEFEEHVGNSLVVREPAGVVGAITPWNYPLNQITLKVAPALAAGCTVVLKPSEVAPLNAFVLAEVIEEAGLPPGVFNLVTGYGPVVGEVLASHPDVDMVSFTGSTRAGKRVAELAAQTVKRVALELGGKSASVILDDADLAAAVKGTLSACFLNSGQTCSAHTRMLVPRAKYEEVKALAAQFAASYVPGDPAQETTRLGPLISAVQRDRVLGYIRKGLEEGAELIAGGPETPEGLAKGFFVKPTVLGNVKTTDTVAREEIFGPVLTVICYDDEEDAIRIANDSIYGLGGGVWSGDEARAIRVARRIRTGQVDINGGPFNMQAPFGGYKQSGNGRENGKYGLEEFLEYKALQLKPVQAA
ncbi:aldehyde dehydrogenase family protein [Ralstonia mannitolilytica]|uniref:3-succinoylsemialdehyde-pyridine dehydrogenase n=1 Tax=Ralstonia mannitolilytica TaxID=105219 RepID=A0AAD2AIL5_9RALS|nr:aldehyde dehydrogenase family protein [Ralstonia mannitolilytica]MBY4719484.1 aldehyde dehydrogenase family protein [Ralstonia mannitolilytica]CAJ0679386.1 3-succinoylsemialdehyde-pyridine dehydrogenase [Ralstonia mannitolilytica]CAJ0696761.1 3-succinoylsemialdehyde-pyridine dehydrogenase [Ralstonia mannitolilytica]CAJ0714293.1 3-succinoylsemialdehyde-pyridine dehydrogenase [Ralstonia mannitolilytica]CAJ0854337.1 3-succinoylsemialdehyde-pyridine dehydrogenase [Ralstonia mannitolilytica]